MIDTLSLLASTYSQRRNVVADVCAKVSAAFAAEKQGALDLLDAVKQQHPTFDGADIEKDIAAQEADLLDIVKKSLASEEAALKGLPELEKAEVAAEKARTLFANRIFKFESPGFPDDELTALRTLKREIVGWLEAVEAGDDPETKGIIEARSRLENSSLIAYLDARMEATNGNLGRSDRIIARWAKYDAVQDARAAWTAFEDRLPAFQAERRQRVSEIEAAIQARFDKFRTSMRERLRGELNTVMESVERFDVGEEKRKVIMSRLVKRMSENQSLLASIEAKLHRADIGMSAAKLADLIARAKALAPAGTDGTALNGQLVSADRFSALAAHLRSHLAFQHSYNVNLNGEFGDRFRSANWNPVHLFEEIKEAAVTA
jgi:hypothetical protein